LLIAKPARRLNGDMKVTDEEIGQPLSCGDEEPQQ